MKLFLWYDLKEWKVLSFHKDGAKDKVPNSYDLLAPWDDGKTLI